MSKLGKWAKRMVASKANPVKAKETKLVGEALKARQQGNQQLEQKLWKEVVDENPEDLRASLAWVQVSRKIDANQEFGPFLLDLSRRFSKEPGPFRELGKIYMRSNPEKSAAYWEKACELDPKHPGSLAVCARLFRQIGQLEKAYRYFGMADQVGQLTADQYAQGAALAVDLQRFSEAETHLAKVSQVEPGKRIERIVAGRIVLARIYQATGERDPQGGKIPVTAKARKSYLEEPSALFENWNKSPQKRTFDQLRDMSRAQKNDTKRTSGEPVKLLFVSDANWNFMQGIVETLANDGRFEVRTLEFNDINSELMQDVRTFVGEVVVDAKRPEPATFLQGESLRWEEMVNWADTIFCEWCNRPLAWLSWNLPPTKKLFVRLHSIEAFSFWPHVVNWGAVDGLITVADHIKLFLQEQINPADFGTQLQTIPNYNNLSAYQLPKTERSRRTLGMVGYNNANKNPLLALELLQRLRATGEDWELLLIGHSWPEEGMSEEDEQCQRDCEAFIQKHQLSAAIREYGFTDQLEEAYREIGYVVSASYREGTHESVMQAMGSGAIPVIRKWPVLEAWGSASNVYDERWIFADAEQMAAFVQDVDSGDKFEALAAEAQKEVFARYDQQVMIPQLIDFLTKA